MNEPPQIATVVKRRRITTAVLFLLSLLVAAFAVKVVLFGFSQPKRPTDSELLQVFHKNRAAFEQLRDMFKADHSVRLRFVSPRGIRMLKPFFEGKPGANSEFPVERYQQYLRLLHQVGGTAVFGISDEHGNPAIEIWAGGWFGSWRHIDIAWVNEVPTNQVTSLDQCRALAPYGHKAYRHIEEKWYFITDMKPSEAGR